jgi:Na+/proline symporter
MTNGILAIVLFLYFILLFIISRVVSKNATTSSFFIGDKKSPWYLVAFGMIGTSLSGVTFVSVPGTVNASGWHYFQLVIGYFVVALVLLPIYYNLKLTSIYTYLEKRLGLNAYRMGAGYFILSRTLGATARLYLVIKILQLFIFNQLGIPFWGVTMIIVAMIVAYTLKGGVKTIVWTDTLQTTFMLLALVVCIISIQAEMDTNWSNTLGDLSAGNYLNLWQTDFMQKDYFIKHILGGAFLTIAMTGLDQEMMQKNISVKSLRDSQKNMVVFSVIILLVNALFLLLGGILSLYASSKGIIVSGEIQGAITPDNIFPHIVQNYLSTGVFILFIIGLISALFPSVDGAITALTSSVCIDIVGVNRKGYQEKQISALKQSVHLMFAFLFIIIVFIFNYIDNNSIVDLILEIAGYTYGPLLGLFSFGILTKRQFISPKVVYLTLLSPVICYGLKFYSAELFGSYQFGNEMLIINGIITFILLFIFSKNPSHAVAN